MYKYTGDGSAPLNIDSLMRFMHDIGYSCELTSTNSLIARHNRHFNVVMTVDPSELFIYAQFPISKDAPRANVLEAVNSCNRVSAACSYYLDDSGNLEILRQLTGSEYFLLEHLYYILQEGDKEITKACSHYIMDYIDEEN